VYSFKKMGRDWLYIAAILYIYLGCRSHCVLHHLSGKGRDNLSPLKLSVMKWLHRSGAVNLLSQLLSDMAMSTVSDVP